MEVPESIEVAVAREDAVMIRIAQEERQSRLEVAQAGGRTLAWCVFWVCLAAVLISIF